VTTLPTRPDVTSRPIPKIVITASASCTEEDLKKEHEAQTSDEQQGGDTSDKNKNKNASRRKRKSSKQKSQLKTTDADADADAGPSGSSETKTEDGATKKEKRKSSFLGLFDGDSGGGDRRLSLQIAARFAKLHIISQLRSLNREKKAAKTVGIIVGCLYDHDLP